MPFVLDASVAACWILPDEHDPRADVVRTRLALDVALAPPIWPTEMDNVLLGAERRSRIASSAIASYVAAIDQWGVIVRPVDVRLATLTVARRHTLTAYDASYLALAMQEGTALATPDRRLRAAARSEGVEVLA